MRAYFAASLSLLALTGLLSSTRASFAQTEPSGGTQTAASASAASTCASSSCRDGFYLRATSGYGYSHLFGQASGGDASQSTSSEGGDLILGGAPARGLVIGGFLRVALAPTASQAAGGFAFDWYPRRGSGWHAGAELGPGVLQVNVDGKPAMSGFDFGGTLFGGYDWEFAHDWSVGLTLSLSGGTPAVMRYAGGSDSGYRFAPMTLWLGPALLFM